MRMIVNAMYHKVVSSLNSRLDQAVKLTVPDSGHGKKHQSDLSDSNQLAKLIVEWLRQRPGYHDRQ